MTVLTYLKSFTVKIRNEILSLITKLIKYKIGTIDPISWHFDTAGILKDANLLVLIVLTFSICLLIRNLNIDEFT